MIAVQLRGLADRLSGLLLEPQRPRCVERSGSLFALIPGGVFVAYALIQRGQPRAAYVFRSPLECSVQRASETVIGVAGQVDVLVHVRSSGPIRRLETVFMHLHRRSFDPSRLSDEFFLRCGQVLGGRVLSVRAIVSRLLVHEDAA